MISSLSLRGSQASRCKSVEIRAVTRNDDHLSVDIDGVESRFHYLWLRDNCPELRNLNGQRLHESNAIDAGIRPASLRRERNALAITWNDGTQSTFPVEFL